ncbi:MAG: branched-chain amino acid ABC transporter permease [Planctomycetes bacterium]|nr:branched-chain amino acid ABC transporter permease [Planctomycetota bacterium]
MSRRNRRVEWFTLAAVCLAVALVPLFYGFRGQVPSTVLKICIYAVMALGLHVVVGLTGLLDLGYVTFMATGAVLTVVSMVAVADPETGTLIIPVGGRSLRGAEHLFHFPGSYLLVLALAGLVCSALGVLRGLPTLHLTGDYYAIVTLGMAEIMYIWYRTAEWTGGPQSLWLNPPDVPTLFGYKLYYDSAIYYFLVLMVFTATIIGSIHLRDSRVGRALSAIRLDPTAAMACGVPVSRYKLTAFAVSGFIGGIGGSLFALWSNGFSAIGMEVWESILLVCCLVLGGIGSVRGALLGSVVLVALGEILRQKVPHYSSGVGLVWKAWPPEARFLFYGLILVALMRFRPAGVLPDRVAGDPFPPELARAWSERATSLFRLGPSRKEASR